MKKYIKSLIVFVILFFIFSTQSFASEEQYKINSYNVKINVGENNVFEVEETICVDYPQEFYGGITMTILKEMEFLKNDGGEISKIAKVYNIKTNEKALINDSIDKVTIKFGNEDTSVNGKKIYSIKYTCDMGKDPYENYDEFYFNIFNNQLDVDIVNAFFEINMPKHFKEKDLTIYSKIKNAGVVYTVNGNTISGHYDGGMNSGEIVTLNMKLPDGYFVTNVDRDRKLLISLIAFSILGVFCSFLLWKKYGDDDPVVKKVMKTVPKKLNSAELGFFVKGEALKDDMLTLFLSLANKGYLKVQEVEEDVLFVKTRTFKVIKIKKYSEKNEYEKMFFDMMFEFKDEITENELRKILGFGLKKLEQKIESKKNIKKVFEDTGSFKGLLVLFIGVLVLTLTLALPMYVLYEGFGLIISLFLITLEMLAFSSVKAIPEYDYSKKRNLILAAVLFLEFLFFITIPVTVVTQLFYFELIYKVTYCVGLICFALIVFIRRYMAKRTKWGIDLLGEVEGFKEYLLNQKEIEEELSKNKQYIYEMLPYVYVLDLVDEWNKVYCNAKIEKPIWYDSQEEVELDTILDFVDNLLTM